MAKKRTKRANNLRIAGIVLIKLILILLGMKYGFGIILFIVIAIDMIYCMWIALEINKCTDRINKLIDSK